MRVTFYAVNVCSKVSVKSCTVKITLGGASDPGDRQSHDDVATALRLSGGEKTGSRISGLCLGSTTSK